MDGNHWVALKSEASSLTDRSSPESAKGLLADDKGAILMGSELVHQIMWLPITQSFRSNSISNN